MGQPVTLQAYVVNQGAAAVEGIAQLKLDLGETNLHLTNPADTIKTFSVDVPVEWDVTAPATPNRISSPIKVTISKKPVDVNSDLECDVGVGEKFLHVSTIDKGWVRVDSLYISSPVGAKDDTLSTRQSFIVRAMISSRKVTNVLAELVFSSEEFDTSPVTREVTVGDSVVVYWNVIAPNSEHLTTPDSMWVKVTAEDEHYSDYKVSDKSKNIHIWTQQRTVFEITAKITQPYGLEDKVSTGQHFVLSAWAGHSGARFNKSDSFKIKMSVPLGYFVEEGRTTVTVKDTARWEIIADTSASDGRKFKFSLLSVPRDVNSGEAGDVSGNNELPSSF